MNKLTRWLAAATIVVATPALAGEIDGTGEFTPVNGYVAHSICSFSGLNDDGEGPSSLVQSYGAFVAAFGHPSPGLADPGTACRGN